MDSQTPPPSQLTPLTSSRTLWIIAGGMVILIAVVSFFLYTVFPPSRFMGQRAGSDRNDASSYDTTLCSDGFTRYEDEYLMLCHPARFSLITTSEEENMTGTYFLTFSPRYEEGRQDEFLSFYAEYGVDYGEDDACITEEAFMVDGQTAFRYTEREDIEGECGNILSITTLLGQKDAGIHDALIYADIRATTEDTREFAMIEQSLRIKQ